MSYRGQSQHRERLIRDCPEYRQYWARLNNREQYVLQKRLEGQTLKEIAFSLVRTNERVRQIEAKACRKLLYGQYLSTKESRLGIL